LRENAEPDYRVKRSLANPAAARRVAWAVLAIALAAAASAAAASSDAARLAPAAAATHRELLDGGRFPSASECRECHPNHFEEWAVSQHAYAQLSPVFNAMQGRMLQLTNGTLGDFCIRCHTPIGMAQGEPLFVSNLERSQPSREGITCAVCHRIRKDYGKVSGRVALAAGGVEVPVSGPTGNAGLKRVLAAPEAFRRNGDGGDQLAIHRDVFEFATLSAPEFCGTCHDVTSPTGVRLEEAFSEYRHSPAAREGTTCQDCHMGREPGVVSGYREASAAVVGGRPTLPRKRTDHRFVGPDYSVIHPGLFPFNARAEALATRREWLSFDWRAGWGTPAFEDRVDPAHAFPARWTEMIDREDARSILDENRQSLRAMSAARLELLRKGYRLGALEIEAGQRGFDVRVRVLNGTNGHNVPTGFVAERLVWLHTRVLDSEDRVLFESGDLDPNGDLRDGHSRYVRAGALDHDDALFTLQSRFVLRNLREGEREEVLAVNHARDPLPFLRPDPTPNFVNGGPAGIRLHKKGIEPGGQREHVYRISRERLAGGKPPLRIEVELKAGMVPVNLVAEIMTVGFDYGMSAAEVARGVVDGHQVLWTVSRELPTSAAP
jgi:hypothetical protein